MTRTSIALFTLLAAALPCSAGAQNPQPAAPQEEHTQLAPPNAASPPPEQVAPGSRLQATTPGTTTLSDRLSQDKGTLHPPVVDPGISAPLPLHSDTMPVIPPPGTPGGNPNVVPK